MPTWQLTCSAQTRAVESPNDTHTLFNLQPKVRVANWLAKWNLSQWSLFRFEPERPVTTSLGLITLWHLFRPVFHFSPCEMSYIATCKQSWEVCRKPLPYLLFLWLPINIPTAYYNFHTHSFSFAKVTIFSYCQNAMRRNQPKTNRLFFDTECSN